MSRPTRDQECVRFLQWALPRLGYRWKGFRKVRRQVCRRIVRRVIELDLEDLAAYQSYLEVQANEWRRLDTFCRITISRFYRDPRLWEVLGREVLPELYERAAERQSPRLRVWSAGCGAGEEPYTMAMLLRLGPAPLPAGVEAEIVATDLDTRQLERARQAVYRGSSLRDLPPEWCRSAFVKLSDDSFQLEGTYVDSVRLYRQDVREQAPGGSFDLIFCRNLVFTYFDDNRRACCLKRVLNALAPDGLLAVGSHEEVASGGRLRRHRSGVGLFMPSTADS